MTRSMRALALVAAALAAAPVLAQSFPAKPLRFVVGLAPGGGTDIVARMVGQKLSQVVNQQVLVENRPGANFMIGTEYVTKAEPDGYTLLLVSSGALTVNPVVFPNLSYDPERDLAFAA